MTRKAFIIEVEEEDIRRERNRARELKKTRWWKERLAKGICYYCRKKFLPRDLTMDHIVPLVRGGRSTKGNVVPVCKECNARKKYLLPMEWEDYLRNR